MTQDEIIEMAIQGHASTRDAIRWAMNQECEAVAALIEKFGTWEHLKVICNAIRARGETTLRGEA